MKECCIKDLIRRLDKIALFIDGKTRSPLFLLACLLLFVALLSLSVPVSLAQSTKTSSQVSSLSSSAAAQAGSSVSSSAASSPGPSSQITKFRFVAWPDTHVSCGKHGVPSPALKAVAATIDKVKPAFVIHTGDMINIEAPDTRKSPCIDVMWSNFKKFIVTPLLNANILFFPTPGNHDYLWKGSSRYKDEWSVHKNNGFKVDGPEGYAGWYSFDYGNSHFISLVIPGTQDLVAKKTQLAWLKSDLEAAAKKHPQHIFVFGHSPLYCPAMNSKRSPSEGVWIKDKAFVDLLKKYKPVYLSGHMHIPFEKSYEGIDTIIDGMLGGGKRKILGRPFAPFQYTVIDVDGPDYKVYRITHPDWDTSALPPAPEVSQASQFSSSPDASHGIGGCPPGQEPVSSRNLRSLFTAPGTQGGGVVPVSASAQGAVVTENDPGVFCSYCGALKSKVNEIQPNTDKKCRGQCCVAKCPPGTRLNNDVPLYKQCSPEIRKRGCSGDTCRNACGHTSFKMITDGLGFNIDMDDFYCHERHTYFLGAPAGWSGLAKATEKLHLKSERIRSADWESVVAALQSGKIGMEVMADKNLPDSVRERCGKGTNGHWIALVGASPDYVIINDPAGNCGYDQERHMVLSKEYFRRIDKNGRIIVWEKGEGSSGGETFA